MKSKLAILLPLAIAIVACVWIFQKPDVNSVPEMDRVAGASNASENNNSNAPAPAAGQKHNKADPLNVVGQPANEKLNEVAETDSEVDSDPLKLARFNNYGVTAPVPAKLNKHVKSVVDGYKQGKGERLSAMVLPKPFDLAAYKADPQKYLDIVEPGRVFQPAQPGKNVPQLRSIAPRMQTVRQGNSVALKVRAPKGAPVTFTSFDLGAFSNRLTSITVEADDKGVALAKFFGTRGTIADVKILAASPMASETVQFIVIVQLDEKAK